MRTCELRLDRTDSGKLIPFHLDLEYKFQISIPHAQTTCASDVTFCVTSVTSSPHGGLISAAVACRHTGGVRRMSSEQTRDCPEEETRHSPFSERQSRGIDGARRAPHSSSKVAHFNKMHASRSAPSTSTDNALLTVALTTSKQNTSKYPRFSYNTC